MNESLLAAREEFLNRRGVGTGFSEAKGTHLVAKRCIAAGEVVLDSPPVCFVHASDSRCEQCFEKESKAPLLNCSACKTAKYCSKECQAQAVWISPHRPGPPHSREAQVRGRYLTSSSSFPGSCRCMRQAPPPSFLPIHPASLIPRNHSHLYCYLTLCIRCKQWTAHHKFECCIQEPLCKAMRRIPGHVEQEFRLLVVRMPLVPVNDLCAFIIFFIRALYMSMPLK